jgi:hypothetical protein
MTSSEPLRISITQQDDDSTAEWSANLDGRIIAEDTTLEALRANLPGVVSALGGDPANFHVLTFRFATPDDPTFFEGPQSYNPTRSVRWLAPEEARQLGIPVRNAKPAPSQEQPHVSKGLRRVSPEEARALGIPPRNDLIISPVPRDPRKPEDR